MGGQRVKNGRMHPTCATDSAPMSSLNWGNTADAPNASPRLSGIRDSNTDAYRRAREILGTPQNATDWLLGIGGWLFAILAYGEDDERVLAWRRGSARARTAGSRRLGPFCTTRRRQDIH